MREAYRSHKALSKLRETKILELYHQRYNESNENSAKINGVNMLDLIVTHNKDCIKNNNQKDLVADSFIVGNISTLFIASFDSSLNASMSTLMEMAQKQQNWINKIRTDGVKTANEI